ncbi:unnamed protein product [Caenorhabditis nigoni]
MLLEHEIYDTIVIKRSMLPDYYRNKPEKSWYIGWVRYAPNCKSEVWFAMSSVKCMHSLRKEVVEVLQKACMDEHIELLGHAIKYGGS